MRCYKSETEVVSFCAEEDVGIGINGRREEERETRTVIIMGWEYG